MGGFYVFYVFSLLIHASQHVSVADNLTFQRFDYSTDMRVLLQAGFVQVNQFGTVIENSAVANILSERFIAVVAFNLLHILLNGLFAGSENRIQQFSAESTFPVIFRHTDSFSKE